MLIKLTKKTNYKKNPFANNSFIDKRYGFWGNVTSVDSKKMKVRVRAATGYEYIGIPVCSNEWVNKDGDNFSGSRNLPPVGARVFVFMPTGTITGAFVLCSGYAEGDTDTHDLYEAEKENERKSISVNGWTHIEDVENSKISLESKNHEVKIEVIPDGDNAQIKIEAFKLNILIDKNGISLDGEKNITLTSNKEINIKAGSNNINIETNKFSIKKDGSTLMEVS